MEDMDENNILAENLILYLKQNGLYDDLKNRVNIKDKVNDVRPCADGRDWVYDIYIIQGLLQ